MIGLIVVDTGGTELGRVKAVLNHGAGDLLEIAAKVHGGKAGDYDLKDGKVVSKDGSKSMSLGDAAKKAVQENEVAMKNLEIEIETRNDSIAKLKIQQYETKKNEEFRAMGTEIERYGNEVRELEDQELELMEKGETLKANFEVIL